MIDELDEFRYIRACRRVTAVILPDNQIYCMCSDGRAFSHRNAGMSVKWEMKIMDEEAEE